MAGLLCDECGAETNKTHQYNEPFRQRRVGVRERHTVGKFFLFIVAVSVAILLAMSVYVISL